MRRPLRAAQDQPARHPVGDAFVERDGGALAAGALHVGVDGGPTAGGVEVVVTGVGGALEQAGRQVGRPRERGAEAAHEDVGGQLGGEGHVGVGPGEQPGQLANQRVGQQGAREMGQAEAGQIDGLLVGGRGALPVGGDPFEGGEPRHLFEPHLRLVVEQQEAAASGESQVGAGGEVGGRRVGVARRQGRRCKLRRQLGEPFGRADDVGGEQVGQRAVRGAAHRPSHRRDASTRRPVEQPDGVGVAPGQPGRGERACRIVGEQRACEGDAAAAPWVRRRSASSAGPRVPRLATMAATDPRTPAIAWRCAAVPGSWRRPARRRCRLPFGSACFPVRWWAAANVAYSASRSRERSRQPGGVTAPTVPSSPRVAHQWARTRSVNGVHTASASRWASTWGSWTPRLQRGRHHGDRRDKHARRLGMGRFERREPQPGRPRRELGQQLVGLGRVAVAEQPGDGQQGRVFGEFGAVQTGGEESAEVFEAVVGEQPGEQGRAARLDACPLGEADLVGSERTTGERLAGDEPAAQHLGGHPDGQVFHGLARADAEASGRHAFEDADPLACPFGGPTQAGRAVGCRPESLLQLPPRVVEHERLPPTTDRRRGRCCPCSLRVPARRSR